jgi:hypothetical protein
MHAEAGEGGVVTASTYREPQHPRGPDGRWKSSGAWQPKHRISGRAKIQTGLGGLGVSGVLMLTEMVNLVTAILMVLSASLVAWGGYQGARSVRRRRKAKRAAGATFTRWGTVRLTTASQIEAFAKAEGERRAQKWARRDEQWGRRKAAVAKVIPRKKTATS